MIVGCLASMNPHLPTVILSRRHHCNGRFRSKLLQIGQPGLTVKEEQVIAME